MSLTFPAPATAPLPTGVALPLPAPGWGAPQALAALAEARPSLPVPLPEPAVVSALTTVVLRSGDLAVKVYPPGTDPGHLDRLRGALAGSTSAHLPLLPAVVTSYGVVTVAPWLPAARPVSWRALGGLLRAFHDEHAVAEVPVWRPLSRLASQVADLPEEAAAVLLGARDVLLTALDEVGSEVGVGAIHGDVSPSNVLRTPTGPRLIDLDWVARAPREYDLASAARRVRAGEISRRAYAGFCAAYGFDVRSWPGLPVLDRVADLGGVAFRLWDSRHHGRDLDWLAQELPVWRTAL
ncbi:phosphotransferase family protein [Nocardioides mesophilus]|uniref:Phosphotransferase n=1 Tax=Nocardioides mesophilus TaxID=433659 RepID=A0A7G9RFH2_9ACTN|nr:phosphotransferase [Nocardioides mesophilus]QNN54347.1 phosphotransferase [Nocardioides mesophilus]